MKVDFAGYVTKANVKCTDGRTIMPDAFKHNDGNVVPMAWQHLSNDPEDILGKMYLEHREDGIYGYGVFNNGRKAQAAKELLRHGDIDSMSIHANHLVERNGNVMHGDIKEVSLVLAGANPGAKIESVTLVHGDGFREEIEDEAVIHYIGEVDNFTGEGLHIDMYHADGELVEDPDDPYEEELEHADDTKDDDEDDEETVEEVFNTLTDKQKNVVYALIGAAIEDVKAEGSSNRKSNDEPKTTREIKQSDEGGIEMRTNPFEKQGPVENTLSHADIENVAKATFEEVTGRGVKFRDALKHAAATYGIDNIEVLFPDAKAISNTPELVKRRSEWVSTILNGTRHVPFSRVKSLFADITEDEARARGYVKGNQKIEEVFPVMTRTTTPQTIYKKQKLDRDDILDITDFDVVAWLRAEMRIMLDEEIARAVLIGDGRLVTSPDKIKEEHIRPIWTDDPFYSYKMQIPSAKANDYVYLTDTFVRARSKYEGTGTPVAFVSPETLTEMLLSRNNNGERLYKTEAELRDTLRVSALIEVPLLYNQVRTDDKGKKWALNAVIVNLADYTIGADKGGEVTNFSDFDIDYNQEKYLIETRISGALVKYHGAVVIETETSGASTQKA